MRQCLETTARLPTFTPTPTLQKGTKIISHLKSQIPRYTPNHPTPTQKKRIKNKSSLNPKDIPKIPNIPTKIPLKKIFFPPPRGPTPPPSSAKAHVQHGLLRPPRATPEVPPPQGALRALRRQLRQGSDEGTVA